MVPGWFQKLKEKKLKKGEENWEKCEEEKNWSNLKKLRKVEKKNGKSWTKMGKDWRRKIEKKIQKSWKIRRNRGKVEKLKKHMYDEMTIDLK